MAEIDFLGKTFGDWEVMSKSGTDLYKCQCVYCGYIKDIRGYNLKTKPPKCKHDDKLNIRKQTEVLNKTFGELTVIELLADGFVRCQCSCGKVKTVHRRYLLNGTTTSCGHDKIGKTSKLVNIKGETFGNWVVEDYLGNKIWACKCKVCDKEKQFRGHILRGGTFVDCNHEGRRPAVIKHFGEWEVIKDIPGTNKWLCRCSCGIDREVDGYALLSGSSKSCGHATTGFKDLTGQQFGMWKVLRKSIIKNNRIMWECECQCENHTIRDLDSYVLRNGISKSCGCLTEELRRETITGRYGVGYASQIGTSRTLEQLEMISSKENLIAAISENFSEMPNIHQLSELLGLDKASTLGHVRKYNLEDIVIIGHRARSWYEGELNKIFPGAKLSDRITLNGREIDLLYKQAKIGIEFNGNYWHSDLNKDITYHQEKSIDAEQNGVNLIHIFEYEWNNPIFRDKLINYIRGMLDDSLNVKIYARDCVVKDIFRDEAKEFLNKYHLQNYAESPINLGCFYDDKLVGVMTFGKPRFTGDAQYEMLRFAWMNQVRVIGGLQELFNYFVNNYNPESIVSYCDISKSSGNDYNALGFKLRHISRPSYVWVSISDDTVLSQKKVLVEDGLEPGDPTEDEIMRYLGYLKIYDCGNKIFIWKPKQEH